MSEWMDIATAPKPHQWFSTNCKRFLLARIFTPVDEGGAQGEPEYIWSHVAYLTSDGWMLETRGIAGTHGYASFRLCDPTHWQPLCEISSTLLSEAPDLHNRMGKRT